MEFPARIYLSGLVLLLLAGSGMAQTFEVATVKPEPPPRVGQIIGMGMTGGPASADPGRVRFSNFTLRDLMSSAYDVDGDRPGTTQIAVVSDHARWHGHNESMYEIARTLGFQTGAPVLDETGLTGKYDFTICGSHSVQGRRLLKTIRPGLAWCLRCRSNSASSLRRRKARSRSSWSTGVEKMPLEN